MNFNMIFEDFRRRMVGIRPFLKTKTGSLLSLIFIALFLLMFFAPLFHGFVGATVAGCVGAVYLILIWRKFDKKHVIVPAVFICIPMLLDMAIYHTLPVVSCFVAAIACVYFAAKSPILSFFDRIKDPMYIYLTAGGICVAVVVLESVFMILVSVAWWILCIVAFLIVLAVFATLVFSTAAYTATDGKRQARKKYETSREDYYESDYEREAPRPRETTMIYDIDDEDVKDVGEDDIFIFPEL